MSSGEGHRQHDAWLSRLGLRVQLMICLSREEDVEVNEISASLSSRIKSNSSEGLYVFKGYILYSDGSFACVNRKKHPLNV